MEIEKLIEQRGKEYGDPKAAFDFVAKSFAAYQANKRTTETLAQDHAVYMILTKLSRIAYTPDHLDSWRDIQGYAKIGENLS